MTTDNSKYYAETVVGAFKSMKKEYMVKYTDSSWRQEVELYSVTEVIRDGKVSHKNRRKILNMSFQLNQRDNSTQLTLKDHVLEEYHYITLSSKKGEISAVVLVERIKELAESIIKLYETWSATLEKHAGIMETDIES